MASHPKPEPKALKPEKKLWNQGVSLKNVPVAVTGAGGFIGSHLVESLLRQGARVRALVRYNSRAFPGFLEEIPAAHRNNLQIVFGNIEDPQLIRSLVKDAAYVFHLAALIGIPYSYDAARSYVQTNIGGTLNILEAAREFGVTKTLITSTSEVYGTALRVPMDEEHPLQAQSPYSATKIAADKMAESYARSFNLPVVVIRPFNTFGPRQSMRAVIPTIIHQALKGGAKAGGTISLGDVTPVRDLNFVTNTVDGFIAGALHGIPDGRVYNLASGEGHTIKDVATCILDILGKKCKLTIDKARVRPEKSEVRRLIGDAGKALNELKWKPKISFLEGLRKTIQWVQTHPHAFPDASHYVK